MAITALGLGTKQAPANTNLDPQRQFWSFLTAFLARGNEGYDVTTSEFGWINGFNCKQTSPAGMSIQIGGGTDAAVLHTYASAGNTAAYLLSTDGEPEIVTIPTAPASGSRIDAVVTYIDTSDADPETETPGTPEYVHTIVVSGTAASSPTSPTNAQIAEALPATAAGKRFIRWCDVTVAASQTIITNSDIKSYKPNAPYVYWSEGDINSLALAQARTVAPRFTSKQNITTNSWTAPSNGIVYFIGNVDTTQFGSTISVAIEDVVVWRTVWNVDAQNYNFDPSGNILVRQGDKVTFAANKGGKWMGRSFVPIN